MVDTLKLDMGRGSRRPVSRQEPDCDGNTSVVSSVPSFLFHPPVTKNTSTINIGQLFQN